MKIAADRSPRFPPTKEDVRLLRDDAVCDLECSATILLHLTASGHHEIVERHQTFIERARDTLNELLEMISDEEEETPAPIPRNRSGADEEVIASIQAEKLAGFAKVADGLDGPD